MKTLKKKDYSHLPNSNQAAKPHLNLEEMMKTKRMI
jgi:hypothetical protein